LSGFFMSSVKGMNPENIYTILMVNFGLDFFDGS